MNKILQTNCIVKVEGSEERGMGFLVDDEHIITCAHVVSPTGSSKDGVYKQPDNRVRVTFPFAEGQPACDASATGWGPPEDEECAEVRDVVVLSVNKNSIPPNARPARLIAREVLGDHFYAYGYPTRYKGLSLAEVGGEICGRLDTKCFQIQQDRNRGIFVQGGFSGTPVWDQEQGGVVGIIVSVDEANGIAHVIPNDELAKTWPHVETVTKTTLVSPIICNIPYLQNKNFTGREEDLANLRARLTSTEPAAHRQVIIGTFGVGKTQLAVEYIYRFHADYQVIWWVRSEDPTTLAADYARLASELNLPAKDLNDQKAIVDAVRRWLEIEEGWLLVFDNAPYQRAIYNYLPRTSRGNVLVTSLSHNWTGEVDIHNVSVFNRQDSIALLAKLTGEHNSAKANDLAEDLDDLPLAIVQAGRYCATLRLTLPEYRKRFRKYRSELLARGEPPTDYRTTVAITFNIALEKVGSDCPAAADLLNLIAFLAPDDIPRQLLMHGVRQLPDTISKNLKNDLDLDDAINVLYNCYSLISLTREAISVHRLNQIFTQDRLKRENKICEWAEAAMRIVSDAFEYEEEDPATWPYNARLLPHGLTAADCVERCCSASNTTASFFDEAGPYLKMRGELAKAQSVLERARNIRETFYGQEHPAVAVTLDKLGLVLLDRGHFNNAKECFKRSLKIREDSYGSEHLSVAWSLNNLGLVLRELDDLLGAQKRYERAMIIKLANYRTETVDVIMTVGNLANVLKALGDLFNAKALSQRVLTFYKTFYGHDHLYVAWSLNNLGLVLQKLYDLEGAKECYERSLSIKEAHYGILHVDVAITEVNLAIVLRHLGQCDPAKQFQYALRAKQLLEPALSIQESTYGPSSPSIAKTLVILGRLHAELDNLESAEKMLKRALKINEETYGKAHTIVGEVLSILTAIQKKVE